jgi:hypothetical protein
MPFLIRPSRRFPVCCPVTYHAGPFQGQGTVWTLSEARRWQEPFSSFKCQLRRILLAHRIISPKEHHLYV